MPGREDFAIIRARFMSDERAHTAAMLYVERGIAHHVTALASVVGHIAMLGVLASRDTDDGVLSATQIAVATMSIGCPPDVRRTMVQCLQDAGLLREDRDGSFYLVGFKDCYADLLRRRKRDAKRKRESRDPERKPRKRTASNGRPAEVRATSGGTGPDRSSLREEEREESVRRTPSSRSGGRRDPNAHPISYEGWRRSEPKPPGHPSL